MWSNIDAYVEKRPRTRAWLSALRRLPLAARSLATTPPDTRKAAAAHAPLTLRRLKLFVLSNASYLHVNTCLRHALGTDWLDLFDAVFVEGRKSALFDGHACQLAMMPRLASVESRISRTAAGDAVSLPAAPAPTVNPPGKMTRAALFASRTSLRAVDLRSGKPFTPPPMPPSGSGATARSAVPADRAQMTHVPSLTARLGYGGGDFSSSQTLCAGSFQATARGAASSEGSHAIASPADLRRCKVYALSGSFTDLQVRWHKFPVRNARRKTLALSPLSCLTENRLRLKFMRTAQPGGRFLSAMRRVPRRRVCWRAVRSTASLASAVHFPRTCATLATTFSTISWAPQPSVGTQWQSYQSLTR